MNAPATTSMPRALPAEHRQRLMGIAREVAFPEGARLFEEGGRADRFWIIRTGTVDLDMRVPGRQAAVIESLGHNELVGWSWLFPPYTWHLGAEAVSPLRTFEFDATAVRKICQEDPEFGRTIARWVGEVVAHRLQAARIRLLDLYGPYGSGSRT
ncbi:cyclic nucleotide-binding domain-containing protein [Streptomyces pseudovenezuelae]|uniref:cyclic nucleotide-binding domain-containing protein n=1 Tax=Streptomyces pseudovenezuelae TaxID=67350 RepID=UPI0034A1EF9B